MFCSGRKDSSGVVREMPHRRKADNAIVNPLNDTIRKKNTSCRNKNKPSQNFLVAPSSQHIHPIHPDFHVPTCIWKNPNIGRMRYSNAGSLCIIRQRNGYKLLRQQSAISKHSSCSIIVTPYSFGRLRRNPYTDKMRYLNAGSLCIMRARSG